MKNKIIYIVVLVLLLSGCAPRKLPENTVLFEFNSSQFRYYTIHNNSENGGLWKQDITVENGEKTKISNDWVLRLIVSDDEKWIVYTEKLSDVLHRLEVDTDEVTLIDYPKGSPIQIYKGWLYYRNTETDFFERIDIANKNYVPEILLKEYDRVLDRKTGYLKVEDKNKDVYEFNLDDL